jgi:hypothetical protein
MKNPRFEKIMQHIGHEIEAVYYGDPDTGKESAVNAALECIDCGCVIIDENPEEN